MKLEDAIVKALNAVDYDFRGDSCSKYAEFDNDGVSGSVYAEYDWHEEDHELEHEGHYYHYMTEQVVDEPTELQVDYWSDKPSEIDADYIMSRI